MLDAFVSLIIAWNALKCSYISIYILGGGWGGVRSLENDVQNSDFS